MPPGRALQTTGIRMSDQTRFPGEDLDPGRQKGVHTVGHGVTPLAEGLHPGKGGDTLLNAAGVDTEGAGTEDAAEGTWSVALPLLGFQTVAAVAAVDDSPHPEEDIQVTDLVLRVGAHHHATCLLRGAGAIITGVR